MRYKDKTEKDGKGYSETKENKEIKSKEGERESRYKIGKTHDVLNDTCAVVANKVGYVCRKSSVASFSSRSPPPPPHPGKDKVCRRGLA